MKGYILTDASKLLGAKPMWDMRKQLLNYEHLHSLLNASLLRMLTLISVFCMLCTSAHADVWGFVDAKGVAHFAAEKLDERYEIFFRGGQSFDTKDGINKLGVDASAGSQPRSASVPKNAPKLLAYFDVSPNFKAVKHHLREASNANNIDMELLQALIATESGFDADAVSPKGAVGLMQLMPATAQRYGVQGDAKTTIEKKLTDPKTNIRAGSRYLHDLIKLFPGKLELALAAYNAGEGAVQRSGNKIPPYKETQNYVKTVMQMYDYLKPPSAVALKQAEGRQPNRVRVQIGGDHTGALGSGQAALASAAPGGALGGAPGGVLGGAPGGARGRGNMLAPLGVPLSAPLGVPSIAPLAAMATTSAPSAAPASLDLTDKP